jgi:hypothetical protein
MKDLKALMVFLMLVLPVIASAQTAPDTVKINFIKTQFADINKHSSTYRKVYRDDMGQSTEGGEATAYFDGKELKKIVSTMYGETGKGTSEYYFYNNKLIFYYEIIYRYNMPFYIHGGGKITSVYATRYYFDNSTIIKYLYKPKKTLSAKELDKEAKEDVQEANRLIKLIHDKNED